MPLDPVPEPTPPEADEVVEVSVFRFDDCHGLSEPLEVLYQRYGNGEREAALRRPGQGWGPPAVAL
jgi:hypothetical protein